MKKLKALYIKRPGATLLLGCYACGLLVLLAVHLAGFAANRAAYAAGTLAPAQLAVADFELKGLAEMDGALVSTDGDPQMILRDSGRRVENVTLVAQYSRPPLMVAAYWAAPGQAHSVRNMAYPADAAGARFLLPAAGGQGLRLDPGAVAGNVITIQSITVNEKRSFIDFFRISAGEGVLLCTLPALAACGLSVLLGLLGKGGGAADTGPAVGGTEGARSDSSETCVSPAGSSFPTVSEAALASQNPVSTTPAAGPAAAGHALPDNLLASCAMGEGPGSPAAPPPPGSTTTEEGGGGA